MTLYSSRGNNQENRNFDQSVMSCDGSVHRVVLEAD